MNDTLRREIETLRTLKTKALKARYRELFGEDCTSSNQAHLFRRIAWRLQAMAQGGLSEQARHRAAELASDADLRVRAPRSFWREVEEEEALPRDPRLPAAGTEITRIYRGRLIVVKVLEHGFEYNGKRFDCLSAIASQVTGTRWNGFSFFRLKRELTNG
jgi:hypothetical protein